MSKEYEEAIKNFEPLANVELDNADIDLLSTAALCSIAISMKRIADIMTHVPMLNTKGLDDMEVKPGVGVIYNTKR